MFALGLIVYRSSVCNKGNERKQKYGIAFIMNDAILNNYTYTPSLFVKNFILPKEREEGIAVEN